MMLANSIDHAHRPLPIYRSSGHAAEATGFEDGPHRRPARRPTRYDRARKNLDRHRDHILAAYLASAT